MGSQTTLKEEEEEEEEKKTCIITLILPYINYVVLIWGNTCEIYLDK